MEKAESIHIRQHQGQNRPSPGRVSHFSAMPWTDNRPTTVGHRTLMDVIHNSPRVVAQRKQLLGAFGGSARPEGDSEAAALLPMVVDSHSQLRNTIREHLSDTAAQPVHPSGPNSAPVQRKLEDLPTEGSAEYAGQDVTNILIRYNAGPKWDEAPSDAIPQLLDTDSQKLVVVDKKLEALPKSDKNDVQAKRTQLREAIFGHRQVLKQYLVKEQQKKTWKFKERGLTGKAKEILEIIGDASPSFVSEDGLERLIELLTTVENPEEALTLYIGSLKADLTKVRSTNESTLAMEERKKGIDESIAALQNTAFKEQFGVVPQETTWANQQQAIAQWFESLKSKEQAMTSFHVAFKAHRLTARNINIGSTARGGRFKAQQLGQRPSAATDREMYLDNTVGGIAERLNPGNFYAEGTGEDSTNVKGLHDLSASILNGDKPIFQQLKYYKDAIVLFVPLPPESDLQIFSALAKLPGADTDAIRDMGARLTRPVFAQSSDMGTRYVDTRPSNEGGEGQFRYGVTGTVIREKGKRARKINDADKAAREKGALTYTEVAKSDITTVNEIVMAYRQHASEIFPMYAKWSQTAQAFEVCNERGEVTGQRIADDGTPKM